MSLKHTNGYAVIDQSTVRKAPIPAYPGMGYTDPIDLNTNEHITNFEICVSIPAMTDAELPTDMALYCTVQGCDTPDFSGEVTNLGNSYQMGNGAGAPALDFRCRPPVIFPRYVRLACDNSDSDTIVPAASKRMQLDIRS